MVWKVIYHPKVYEDLKSLGAGRARDILKVIEERLVNGSPNDAGQPLRRTLAGFRRIRTGNCRIVYRAEEEKITVLVLCVGLRRDNEVYALAARRLNEAVDAQTSTPQ